MTSWHETITKDGTHTGKLVKCKNDPCPLDGHGDDIHADTIHEAYWKLEAITKKRVEQEAKRQALSRRSRKTSIQRKNAHKRNHNITQDPTNTNSQGNRTTTLRTPTKDNKHATRSSGNRNTKGNREKTQNAKNTQATRSIQQKIHEKNAFTKYTLRYGGKPITRKHFNGTVDKVSGVITQDDWEHLRAIETELIDRTTLPINYNVTTEERRAMIEKKIQTYLESDDENAVRYREYCGDDVSMSDVASILSRNVHAMTDAMPYSGKNERRCILSATSNDMTRKRYIASVLFFGGRCCYCGIPLKKSMDGSQRHNTATGEHLEPLDGNPPGETKFGNMALCCVRCNKDKANKPLNEWMNTTKLLSDEQKTAAQGIINSFHDFTLYEPMSVEQGEWVNNRIDEVRRMRRDGKSKEEIKTFLHETISMFKERNGVTL